mgnify:CR=1 FL=1
MADGAAQQTLAMDALQSAVERHYPAGVLQELTQTLGAQPLAAAALEKLPGLLDAEPKALAALSALALRKGKGRGGRLRRLAIMQGWGEIDQGLETLIAHGLVILMPAPGQRQWSLNQALGKRRHLQRELRAPEALLTWVDQTRGLLVPGEGFGLRDESIKALARWDMDRFERNLLRLTASLDGDGMALNKDLSPNRRSLARFVRGLGLPTGREIDDQSLAHPQVEEPLRHMLALARTMNLVSVEGGRMVSVFEPCAEFFQDDAQSRERALLRAYRTGELWFEVEAQRHLTGAQAAERPHVAGKGLAGARSQVLSDLAQLPIEGWALVEQVVGVLLALDRGFLAESIGSDIPVATFVQSILMVALPWLGVLELGQCADGRTVMRWTERGRRAALERDAEPDDAVRPPPLIVQPNFEVTVFAADASLKVLYGLHSIGELRKRNEHVATFVLDAIRVQRAYGRGQDAEAVIEFLKDASRTPVPDNVVFALRDWKRVQRKLTLYTCGALLHMPGVPDRLDALADRLEHLPAVQGPVVKVGLEGVFVPEGQAQALVRHHDLDALHLIDYATAPPACFAHLGGVEIEALPTGLDMVTEAEIESVAVAIEVPEDQAQRWRLDAGLMRQHWPQDTTAQALAFLSPRVEGGVKPHLELPLRALLDGLLATARVGVTVVTLSEASAVDRLLDSREADELIEARLGPKAVMLASERWPMMEALLVQLGLMDELDDA